MSQTSSIRALRRRALTLARRDLRRSGHLYPRATNPAWLSEEARAAVWAAGASVARPLAAGGGVRTDRGWEMIEVVEPRARRFSPVAL